jgi:glutaredoxin
MATARGTFMSDPNSNPKRLFSVFLFLLPSLAAAGIFSWTDETGKVHYGDRPPIDRAVDKVTVRVNTYASPSEISQLDSPANAQGKVVLYTTQRCGYCKMAKAYLKRKNIGYTEYDVETSKKGQLDFKKLNGSGVPIILVGDQRMNGFSEGRMASMLKKAGYD